MSLVIFVAGGEILIRLYDHMKGVTPPYTHNLPECIAVPNGYFNFDLQPNLKVMYDSYNPRKFSINRWGFRADDYDPVKPKDIYRIFCFGGSSTFDPYVGDERSWAAQVGTKLSSALGRKVESINAGRYGYTMAEIVSLFYHRVLRHQPDLIIIYSTYNDAHIEISPYYSRDDGVQMYGSPLLSFLNKHSAFFAYFDFRLRSIWPTSSWYVKLLPSHIYVKKIPPEHEKFITDKQQLERYLADTYRRHLKTVIHMAKDNNVQVLLSTQVIDNSFYTPVKRRITDVMREVSKEENVPILDFDTFNIDPAKEKLLYTYVHLSPKGCDYVSDKMADAVIKNGMIR
jgi:lysophospholipase L1-like esterase